jgi:hypothetical protein
MTTLTISRPPETAARLEREAQARGMSAEAIVAEAVEAWTEADDLDWEEDERRLNEPGANIPLDVAFDRLEARIAAKRAAGK